MRIQTESCYANHKQQKMLPCGERVRRGEHGTLTPLVFTCTVGAGPLGTHFIQRLASKISDQWDMPYSQAVGLLRCRISFTLLHSATDCLVEAAGRSRVRQCSLELLPPRLAPTSFAKWDILIDYLRHPLSRPPFPTISCCCRFR